jgi:hypothetical protein
MCDLRGCGDSSKPDGGKDHSDYSERPMALDGVEEAVSGAAWQSIIRKP